MKKHKPLSWKPVRKGKFYCAPACGRACTHEEYLKAKEAAKELCALLGPNWKPRVWENLGWHYEAKARNMTVSPRGWSAWESTSDYRASYDIGANQFEGEDADPRRAVVKAYLRAQKLINETAASNKALLNELTQRWKLPAPARRLRG